MKTHFATQEDIDTLKKELFNGIKELLEHRPAPLPAKQWIKTYQLKQMLPLSDGKLQQLRSSG